MRCGHTREEPVVTEIQDTENGLGSVCDERIEDEGRGPVGTRYEGLLGEGTQSNGPDIFGSLNLGDSVTEEEGYDTNTETSAIVCVSRG
jgi:hypothetical protein